MAFQPPVPSGLVQRPTQSALPCGWLCITFPTCFVLLCRAALPYGEIRTGGQVLIIKFIVCHALCMKIGSWLKFGGWRRLPRTRKRFGPIDIPATPLWTQLNHEHLDIVHLYLKFLYTEHRLNMTTFGCNGSRQWNKHFLLSYKIVLFHIGVRQNQSCSVSCCLARVQDFLSLSWEQAFPFELWTALDLLIRFCFFVVLPKELRTMEQTDSIPKAGAVWQRLATNGLGIGERSEILSH